jgi:methionyl-tRNA synthetase
LTWGELEHGTSIGEVKALFPRIDKAKLLAEIQSPDEKRLHATEVHAVPGSSNVVETKPSMTHATEADAVGVTSFIEIGDFAKVDLRVGQVLSAERVPKSDKLLLLQIDVAEEKPRQILAGIAEYYAPEKMIGRKVVVVANLKPRKLRGYESQGMVVAASYGEEGRPVIATFDEEVPNGARLK